MLEIILSLGALGTILSIIAAILFFFLPFYVAGIYYRVIKCQQELEKINQSIRVFEIAKNETLNKEDKIKLKMAERAQDPNSIFDQKKYEV